MTEITIAVPEALAQALMNHCAQGSVGVTEFIVRAIGEKLTAIMTHDYWNRELEGVSRDAFEKYLAAVPDVEPDESDRK